MRFLLIILAWSTMAIAQADALRLLPPAQFQSGWKYDFEPETFSTETLHEYINGEAELYRRFGVQETATASYIEPETNWNLTIDIYNMGSALDAFGVYSHYRRPELTFAEIGSQAIVSDYQIRFYKSRFYVQLNATSADSGMQRLMRTLANSIAEKIEPVAAPLLLQLLPDSSSVPHSARLYSSRFAGLEFKTPVLIQTYRADTGEFQALAAQYASAAEAFRRLQTMQASEEWNGIDWQLVQQQNILIGLQGELDDERATWFHRSIQKNLAKQ